MKVEEIKLALQKNKETHLQFALADDFLKKTKAYDSASEKFKKSVENLVKSNNDMKQAFLDISSFSSSVDSEYQNLRKKVSEIGVEMPNNIVSSYNNFIKKLKDDSSEYKKYKIN